MWRGTWCQIPRGFDRVMEFFRCLPSVVDPRWRWRKFRNWESAEAGGGGIWGQLSVEFACHCPVNLFAGMIVPSSLVRSAKVMTWRNNLT